MSNHDQTFLTKEGLEKLKKELEELRTVKRKEIAERVQLAKEFGDLSENAEYVEAKNEQSFIEGRILELETTLKNVTIFKEGAKSDTVRVGSTVTVSSNGDEKTYTIVGSNEANPTEGRISNRSPLGQGFLGKKVGDDIEVVIPKGKTSYRITHIA